MGGPTYKNHEEDCSCNPCVGEDCDKETPKDREETVVKWCMQKPSIKCHMSDCMAWCTSEDGKSGQCLHGIFKQMLMTSVGSLAQMLRGGAIPMQKKESSIVRPI